MIQKTNKINVELSLGDLFSIVTALVRNSQRLIEMGAHSSLVIHQLTLAETLNVKLADSDFDCWSDEEFQQIRKEAYRC